MFAKLVNVCGDGSFFKKEEEEGIMIKNVVYFSIAIIFLALLFSGRILGAFSFIFLVAVCEDIFYNTNFFARR